MQSYKQSAGMREILCVLFKHKKKIIFTFAAVVIGVAVVSLLMPPTYESKATVMIKVGREHMLRPETGDTRSSVFFTQGEGVVNSEIQILTSRDLIARVITAIGPDRMYRSIMATPLTGLTPMELALQRFEQNLKVEQKPKTDVISITFSHGDPKIAAQSVNLLVDNFRDKHLKVFSGTAASFLEKQAGYHEQKLRQSEQNLEDFKQKYKVYSLEEQRALLLKQRTDLDTSMLLAQNEIRELQQNVAPGSTAGRSAEQQASINNAKAQLLTLQLKEQELTRKYNDETQLVRGIREEIKVVRGFINEQEKSGDTLEKSRIRTAINAQRARTASLASQIAAIDAEIREINLRERELQNFKRELAMNEANYQTYVKRLEEARISDEMESQKMANISVLQAATVPTRPVAPDVGKNMLLALLFGAMSGVGLAFASEYSAQGLSSPESARKRLGLPVLLSLPYKE